MRLFPSFDKNIIRGQKQELPFQMRGWFGYVEDDEDVSAVEAYQSAAAKVGILPLL
jgi:hypothetical protein